MGQVLLPIKKEPLQKTNMHCNSVVFYIPIHITFCPLFAKQGQTLSFVACLFRHNMHWEDLFTAN